MQRELKKFLSTLAREVSDMAVEEFKENFRRGGYRSDGGLVKWKERTGDKKGKKRALLIKSGRLKRGIRARPEELTAVVVNDVPYAEIHNSGFIGGVTVKAHKRVSTRRVKIRGGFSGTARKGRTVSMRIRGARGNVRSHTRRIKMPARPFMKPGKPFYDDVEKYIDTNLEKIFNK